MRMAKLGGCIVAVALVATGRGARAQERMGRIAPLFARKAPVTRVVRSRAQESPTLSRPSKPSDPDATALGATTAVGRGVGAAGLCVGGLLLLVKLGAKKPLHAPETGI